MAYVVHRNIAKCCTKCEFSKYSAPVVKKVWRLKHLSETVRGNGTDHSWQNDVFIQKSAVICRKAAVCSDQPLATNIGIDILKKGGNAADAAVATMQAVSVIQPNTCGLGGDVQCMFYRNADKAVLAVNGSGRTGKNATLQKIREAGIKDFLLSSHRNHGLRVSVPGAVAAMFDVVKHFGSGKLTMGDLLAPAIQLAEEGVPVPFKAANQCHSAKKIIAKSRNGGDFLIQGEGPKPGDIIRAPKLARCLKDIIKGGPEAFYQGAIARRIVKAVQEAGGVLTLDDMADHIHHPPTDNPVAAVCVDFHGFRVWEMKPNTIGIVALLMLNILKGYDWKALNHNSAEYVHILSEANKLAYLECWDILCDPAFSTKPVENFLTEEIAEKLRNRIDSNKILGSSGMQSSGGNTSYVAVVDEEGNGCSMFSSTSSNFGSGIIPDECGFPLHDRATCMSLDERSPNAFGPCKLPVHSLAPCLVTEASAGELLAVLGVPGRWMQPQGQVQVLLSMIGFGMDPQTAVTQPRFCVGFHRALSNYTDADSLELLYLEGGIHPDVAASLEIKGHRCRYLYGRMRETFGSCHVITRPGLFWSGRRDAWWSGADPRSDGCAIGY